MNDYENPRGPQENENGSRLIMNVGNTPKQSPYPPQPEQPAYPPQPDQPVYQQQTQPIYQQQAQPAYQQPAQPMYQQTPIQQPAQPTYQQPGVPPAFGGYDAPPKKKKTGLLITLIIVGVLLIGGIVGGLLLCGDGEGGSVFVKEDVKIERATVKVMADDGLEGWAGAELCVLKEGDTIRDIRLETNSEGYTVEIAYVKLLDDYGNPEDELSKSEAFIMDRKYRVGIKFSPIEGYTFTDSTVFQLEGNNSGQAKGEDNILEFDTYAGSLKYAKVSVSPYRESSTKEYTFGTKIATVVTTSLGKTVRDCNRIELTYALRTINLSGSYSWKVYVRSPDGSITHVKSFDASAYTTTDLVIDFSSRDVNGVFVTCDCTGTGNWDGTLTINKVYAQPGSN